MNRRHAFTLIEMMIALAAGAAILLIAVAGFRSASQIVKRAQGLNEENISIASGISQAFDELDFWHQYDVLDEKVIDSRSAFSNRSVYRDPGAPQFPSSRAYPLGSGTNLPGDSGGSPQPNTRRVGLPFSPFGYNDQNSDLLSYKVSWGAGAVSAAQGVNDFGRGWQENELLWVQTADNPLTWWSGLGMQRCFGGEANGTANGIRPVHFFKYDRFGRYQILGVSASSGLYADGASSGVTVPVRAFASNYSSKSDYSTTDVRSEYGWNKAKFGSSAELGAAKLTITQKAELEKMRRQNPGWIFDKIRGSRNAMGDYGMFDYMPVNVIYAYTVSPYSNVTDITELDQPDSAGRIFFMAYSYDYDSPKQRLGGYFAPYVGCARYWDHGWQSMPYDFNMIGFLVSRTLQPMVDVRDRMMGRSSPGTNEIRDLRVYFNRHGLLLGPGLRSLNTQYSFSDPDLNFRNGFRVNNGYTYDFSSAQWVDEYNPNVETNYAARVATHLNLSTSVGSGMPIIPKSWVSISVASARFLYRGRLNNQVKVGWADGKGGVAELKFSGMGSTLRGARRQRDSLEYPNRTPEN